MQFLLNSHNVFDYLASHGLCSHSSKKYLQKIEPIEAKNFNLLLTFSDGHKLLVKQERQNHLGKASGEFLHEWHIQELLQTFPELHHLRSGIPEVLHFDSDNFILVFRYLDEYQDLIAFYHEENIFPLEIASAIGKLLGKIHRDTFNHQDYQNFFYSRTNNLTTHQIHRLIRSLERIDPTIFGLVPADGLKFYALYQRYDSLGQAIAQLSSTFTPCCVTHNDLKLNNILIHKDWQQEPHSIVRLIDWERSNWGDPAFDLGTIISCYLQIWLSSLVISKSLSIEESLRLAMTPLETLQPSIVALIQNYFDSFPAILKHRPDFLEQIMPFAGFDLIQRIQSTIEYQKTFGNAEISMLQVAKTLLCRPEQSIATIFGVTAAELTQITPTAVVTQN